MGVELVRRPLVLRTPRLSHARRYALLSFARSLVRSFARSPGDEIEIDGQFFIVEKTRVRWKLERGRYVRDHKRLDVLGTGRYLSNMFLNSLLEIETSDEEEEGGGRR